MKIQKVFEYNSDEMTQDDIDNIMDAFIMYIMDKRIGKFELIESIEELEDMGADDEMGYYAYKYFEDELYFELIILRGDGYYCNDKIKKMWNEGFKEDIIELENRIMKLGFNVEIYYYAFFCRISVSKEEIPPMEFPPEREREVKLPGFNRYRYNGKARF